jgi:hypothetical protein
MNKEAQLRTKEEQLRQEKLLLLEGADVSPLKYKDSAHTDSLDETKDTRPIAWQCD